MTPLLPLGVARVRLRFVMGVSGPSPHLCPGVSKKSPPSPASSPSSWPERASRLRADPGSSTRLRTLKGVCSGGEGVESGAEDGAVVWDDTEGTLWFLPGVEMPDTSEPRERSGSVMADCEEESARALSAADMMLASKLRCQSRFKIRTVSAIETFMH